MSPPSKAAFVSGRLSDDAPAARAGSEQTPAGSEQTPAGSEQTPFRRTPSGGTPRRAVAVVPGRWIDPGEEAGAPGERVLNLVIANRAHAILGADGWTVLRPDLASPPLARERYEEFVRAQTVAGVPVLEIHGAGTHGGGDGGANRHGMIGGGHPGDGGDGGGPRRGPPVAGVIAQDASALGSELSKTFGTIPSGTVSWRDLAAIRGGAVAVESFDAAELEAMDPVARSARVDAIARDLASAIGATGDGPQPPEGCSASGCPRRRDDDP